MTDLEEAVEMLKMPLPTRNFHGKWVTLAEHQAAALLAELERLREENEQLRAAHKDLSGVVRLYHEAIDTAGCPKDESQYAWITATIRRLEAAEAVCRALAKGSGDCPGCGTYIGDPDILSHHSDECEVGNGLAAWRALAGETHA